MRFIVAIVAFALFPGFLTVDASKKKREENDKFTIFQRQSDYGFRHSPVFFLPVGGAEGEFPSKMALFHNDLYGSENDLINQEEADIIGYNQVRR